MPAHGQHKNKKMLKNNKLNQRRILTEFDLSGFWGMVIQVSCGYLLFSIGLPSRRAPDDNSLQRVPPVYSSHQRRVRQFPPDAGDWS